MNTLKQITLSLTLLVSCGQDSQVDCEKASSSQCVERNEDEQSVILLNENKTDEAITLLETLVANAPADDYSRHVRLAAAYAAKADLDLIAIAESLQSETQGAGLVDDVTEANKLQFFDRIFYIDKAVSQLKAIPADHRKKSSELTEAEKESKYYSGSANTQFFLYTAVHTQMCEKTLNYIAVNFSERTALSAGGKASSCGPLEILDNLGAILSQIEGCDICTQAASGIEEINQQISEAIGEETDITKATDAFLNNLCKDQRATNPDLNCDLNAAP